jgi:hypothetical protein
MMTMIGFTLGSLIAYNPFCFKNLEVYMFIRKFFGIPKIHSKSLFFGGLREPATQCAFLRFRPADSVSSPAKAVPTSANDWPKITMYDTDFRSELHAMYEAITELKLWKEVAKDPGPKGFMFSSEKYIEQIGNHPKVEKCGHSGATHAYAMRQMQQLARDGWSKYYETHTKASIENKQKLNDLNPIKDFLRSGK